MLDYNQDGHVKLEDLEEFFLVDKGTVNDVKIKNEIKNFVEQAAVVPELGMKFYEFKNLIMCSTRFTPELKF
jgi:hypothetical protein